MCTEGNENILLMLCTCYPYLYNYDGVANIMQDYVRCVRLYGFPGVVYCIGGGWGGVNMIHNDKY